MIYALKKETEKKKNAEKFSSKLFSFFYVIGLIKTYHMIYYQWFQNHFSKFAHLNEDLLVPQGICYSLGEPSETREFL